MNKNLRIVLSVGTLVEFTIIGVVLPLVLSGLQDIWYFFLIGSVLIGISSAESLYRLMEPDREARPDGGLTSLLAWIPPIGLALALHRVYKWVKKTDTGAGLNSGPGIGNYRVSKYRVVAPSETLHHELQRIDAKVKLSVLCPGVVSTQIMDSGRNRPTELPDDSPNRPPSPEVISRPRQPLPPGG